MSTQLLQTKIAPARVLTPVKKPTGIIVNTSAIAAKQLDVTPDGRSSSAVLLSVAVNETNQQTAYTKKLEAQKASEESFLRSLQDGSYFGVMSTSSYSDGSSYGNSYNNSSYSNGGYGQFISQDPGVEDLERYGLTPDTSQLFQVQNQVTSRTSTTSVEVQVVKDSTWTKIKLFLVEHKLFALLAVLAALFVVFRKNK